MPRLAATNRGTGVSERNSENDTNAVKIKGKSVMESRTRSSVGLKRQAEETIKLTENNSKTRRRAALGEITNVSISVNLKLLILTVSQFNKNPD